MTTLTEFILERIAEDEAVALGVKRSQEREYARMEALPGWRGVPYGEAALDTEVSSAAGRQDDPLLSVGVDRMLAECEAKRRIVEMHESWPVLVETPTEVDLVTPDDPTSFAFRASKRLAWLTEQEYRARFGDEPPTAPMLAALAAVYADHPDCREEWRP